VSESRILERERSRALPTAIATFAGLVLLIVATVVAQGALSGSESDSQVLSEFPDHRGTLLESAILQAIGLTLLIAPLFYLFQAASARSEQMRHALIGITVAGPLFLGASFIFQWVALDQASSEFATPGGGVGIPVGEYAEDLIDDQGALGAAQGFDFAGRLGLAVAILYTALHAMRVGLLTRFWGTLGMALGVAILFFGPFALFFFFVPIGLLIGGWWPGDRPPAWDAGRAVPWPAPGEAPEPEDSDRPADPEQFAEPVEGTGTEVGGETAESPQPAPGSGSRRKRKRRG
jgi:hypothetical protein